ncbi:putative transcription factor interactor and regulator LIM family [Helianthus annuus]|uniref:Transcription factor interactor and regulator LIM family n=2 Tax=Helianthus annuus TaxID=4232 RepID=A0A9K3J696_HELAN|nr:protein DA1-related 1 [Helianthus annuus]XP_022034260.1 protein DA1-related 1 [Helianthus annuus]KAF5809159.1 putative transcription factor interactor and regulator LIM family [Helianthus annuus]
MDWLSRIFEGSNRGVSWDSRSDFEDFDRAIAMSLAEGRRRHGFSDDFLRKEDERLAKALHGRLKLEPSPWNRNMNRNANVHQPPMSISHSTGYRKCAGCNNVISHGQYLRCMGAVWHPECLKCHACNLPISDNEFLLSGNYPYHKSCYRENHHPRCDVCRQFIRTDAAGFVEYKVHPFWAQKYCPRHERDGTPRCCSCDRFEPKEIQYAALNDGRKLCLECLDSAIMGTSDCQPLYHDIQQFFASMNMKLEQKIPLLLVERQALNEAMDGETNGHYHMPETRGLCLSEEQVVSTVSRQPRIGMGNRVPNTRIEPYQLTRHAEVTAILILYGLPRLLTGSILAHEMMHAWLRLKGYPTLRPDVEEGICQTVAHMWLTAEIALLSRQGRRSPFEKKLADFFKQQIESDMSPVYGNGFRAGNRAVLKYGLQKTLYHIRSTGSFPN